jgi:hypothetical protein
MFRKNPWFQKWAGVFSVLALIHLGLKPQAIGSNPLKRVHESIKSMGALGYFRGSSLEPVTRFNGFERLAWGFNPRCGEVEALDYRIDASGLVQSNYD